MTECWFCYWGWPKAIDEIYQRAKRDIDALLPVPCPENDWTEWDGVPLDGEAALDYGPAHCVWSDENFGDVNWSLKECDSKSYERWHPGTMDVVRRSLRELAALPLSIREPPEGYGRNKDDHPKNFPPQHDMEMVYHWHPE